MIALEMNGPKNDEVLPITPKREKKRNSLPRGVTSDICHPIILSTSQKIIGKSGRTIVCE